MVKEKYPTVSKNIKDTNFTNGYSYNRVFKDLKLADLQQVIGTCRKEFPNIEN